MANATVKTKKTVKKKRAEKPVKVKQTAGIFRMLKKTFKGVQVFSGFYAFVNLIYWCAYSSKIVGETGLSLFFQPLWNLVNNFYTYKPADGTSELDFTGVVATLCLIVFSIILKSIVDYLAEAEETAQIQDQIRLERAKKKARAEASKRNKAKLSPKKSEYGFVFLLDIDITQVAGFIQDTNLSPQEIASIKTKFFESLLNNLNFNQVSQKGYYKKKLFLIYKNIYYLDDFVFYTRETLMSLAKEFTLPTIRIDFLVGMHSISVNEEFKDKLDIIDIINKLGLKNEFICTQSLKTLYENLPKQNYTLVSKGIYNLSKNLNISNNQEIFSLKEDT